MCKRGILLLTLLAFLSQSVLADHQPTAVIWSGWQVESGAELYLNKGGEFSKYPLTNLFDGDPKTCWVYNSKPDPKNDWSKPGPWLVLVPDWPVTIDSIGIINGYAKSEELYRHNDRAAHVRITINGNDHGILPPGATKAVHEADLGESLDVQKIVFQRQKAYCLRIDITAVTPGQVHDLCISELELRSGVKKIDMHMPAVLRYTPGDECGCGTTYTVIDRSGKKIFRGSGGDLGNFAAWDSTGRYLADIAYGDGQDGELAVIDATTGKVIHRQATTGEVRGIDWNGRRMTLTFVGKKRKPITFTVPAAEKSDAASQPDHPDYEDWQDAWGVGQWVLEREKSGDEGKKVLLWPWKLPKDITQRWATQHGLLGLTADHIEKKFGRPANIVSNESTNAKLYVYPNFSVAFTEGKCDGWAPRAANYEKWFAQPKAKKP